MLLMIVAVVVALLLIVLGIAAAKPSTFRVQRSSNINAKPEKIFSLIDDFHEWPLWSPWENVDPEMKRTFSGETSGPGAVYQWDGNRKVGQGRMEIINATPLSKLVIKLDFLRPFEGHNTAEFTLERQNDSTNVVWCMYGPMAFVPKLFSVFVSMDRMMGKQFETGLRNLKLIAEK